MSSASVNAQPRSTRSATACQSTRSANVSARMKVGRGAEAVLCAKRELRTFRYGLDRDPPSSPSLSPLVDCLARFARLDCGAIEADCDLRVPIARLFRLLLAGMRAGDTGATLRRCRLTPH